MLYTQIVNRLTTYTDKQLDALERLIALAESLIASNPTASGEALAAMLSAVALAA